MLFSLLEQSIKILFLSWLPPPCQLLWSHHHNLLKSQFIHLHKVSTSTFYFSTLFIVSPSESFICFLCFNIFLNSWQKRSSQQQQTNSVSSCCVPAAARPHRSNEPNRLPWFYPLSPLPEPRHHQSHIRAWVGCLVLVHNDCINGVRTNTGVGKFSAQRLLSMLHLCVSGWSVVSVSSL